MDELDNDSLVFFGDVSFSEGFGFDRDFCGETTESVFMLSIDQCQR